MKRWNLHFKKAALVFQSVPDCLKHCSPLHWMIPKRRDARFAGPVYRSTRRISHPWNNGFRRQRPFPLLENRNQSLHAGGACPGQTQSTKRVTMSRKRNTKTRRIWALSTRVFVGDLQHFIYFVKRRKALQCFFLLCLGLVDHALFYLDGRACDAVNGLFLFFNYLRIVRFDKGDSY